MLIEGASDGSCCRISRKEPVFVDQHKRVSPERAAPSAAQCQRSDHDKYTHVSTQPFGASLSLQPIFFSGTLVVLRFHFDRKGSAGYAAKGARVVEQPPNHASGESRPFPHRKRDIAAWRQDSARTR